jgi:hypothetical protein
MDLDTNLGGWHHRLPVVKYKDRGLATVHRKPIQTVISATTPSKDSWKIPRRNVNKHSNFRIRQLAS